MKRIIALIAVLIIVITMCSCGRSSENLQVKSSAKTGNVNSETGAVKKEETVFVSLDSVGEPQIITVSDRLTSEKTGVYVDDMSVLSNIVNLTSGTKVENKTGVLRWFMSEKSIYYTGETEKELPLKISIEYYLDGAKMKSDEIFGKNGAVEIRVSTQNQRYRDIVIDGRNYKVYLPMAVVGIMILSNDCFSGITVENAVTFGDGKREYIMFFGLPGVGESLGINELVFEDTVVSASANNFKMNEIYFAAVPLTELRISSSSAADEVKNIASIIMSFKEATEKADANGGLSSLFSDSEKISELVSAAASAVGIYENNRELAALLSSFSDPEKIKVMKEAAEVFNKPEIIAALEFITDEDVIKLLSELPSLSDSMEKMAPVLAELQKIMQNENLQSEIDNLPQTLGEISSIINFIDENGAELNALVSLLENDEQDFYSLIKSINEMELNSITDKYSMTAYDGKVFLILCDEWLKLGSEYGVYSGCMPETETKTIFIFKCAPVY